MEKTKSDITNVKLFAIGDEFITCMYMLNGVPYVHTFPIEILSFIIPLYEKTISEHSEPSSQNA